jgi:hypothetical protein
MDFFAFNLNNRIFKYNESIPSTTKGPGRQGPELNPFYAESNAGLLPQTDNNFYNYFLKEFRSIRIIQIAAINIWIKDFYCDACKRTENTV